MSVITPNETAMNWKASKREQAVHLYLSGAEGDAAELAAARVAGLPVHLSILPTTDWINPEELDGAAAAVIQVDADSAGLGQALPEARAAVRDAADRRRLRTAARARPRADPRRCARRRSACR